MKKLIILCCFLLTGCFENSGYLIKSCSKIETVGDFKSITTYTFGFKNDLIENLEVTFDYQGSKELITALKTSLETNYRQLSSEVLIDLENQYQITYILPLDSDLNDKFVIKSSRTDLVKELEEKGFSCEWKKYYWLYCA